MKDYSSEKITWPVQGAHVGASKVDPLGYDAGWAGLAEQTKQDNATGEELTGAGSEPSGEGRE